MQTEETPSLGATIRAALRRHLVLIAVATLLGGALGYAASRVVGQTYTSTAAIILRPAAGNSLSPLTAGGTSNQVNIAMTTEVSLVTTPTVAQAAGEIAKTTLPTSGDKVGATVPASTQIIEVAYTSASRERAQLGAQAYADAFLASRKVNAEKSIEAQVASLQKQLSTAESNLKTASAQAASSTDPRSYAQQQLQLFAERVATLKNQIGDAQAASTDPGQVIRRAQTPVDANGFPSWLLALLGALLGLGAGALIAIVRQVSDRRVDPSVSEAVEGLPIMAHMSATATPAEVTESYRQLRTAVVAGIPRGSIITITSVDAKQPTAPIVQGLADVLTHSGFRCAVIDLAGQLEGGIPLPQPLAEPAADGSGPRVFALRQASLDDIASPSYAAFRDSLRPCYDYTLVAAGSVGSSAGDAATAGSDATIVVGTARETTSDQLRAARQRVLRLGSAAAGFFPVTGHLVDRAIQPVARALEAGKDTAPALEQAR